MAQPQEDYRNNTHAEIWQKWSARYSSQGVTQTELRAIHRRWVNASSGPTRRGTRVR